MGWQYTETHIFSLNYSNFSLQVTRAIADQFGSVSKGDITKEEVERAKYVVVYNNYGGGLH
jgi:hypothetical protein